MRASRLLSMLILLQMRGRVSAAALAREFEVSVRTIYRDIDQLSAAGVPVYAERGRSGGFALLDGYRTKLTGFTAAEAHALLLMGAGSAAADLGIGAELAAAQLKLLASLPAESGASAHRVATRFHLDPAGWYAGGEPMESLPVLASAVWRNRRIHVRYESWKDVVSRALDPLGLVLKGGVWYLVAASKGQPRTYRVSNIRALEVSDAEAPRPARFDLARYWAASAQAFEARLLSERADIALSPAGLQLLRDTTPALARAAEAGQRPWTRPGWVRAEVPVEGARNAARQLLRLGVEVKVLGPPRLRAALVKEARQVAGLYGRARSRAVQTRCAW
ncbi:MAG: YafY family protein [Rhizomicrobium sp.]